MTQQEVFGKAASWVTPGDGLSYPYIRRAFRLPPLKSAVITITGLGNFILSLNGRRVGEDLFLPLYTDYEPCTRMTDLPFSPVHVDRIEKEELGHRILCIREDVTEYLRAGENCIGIRLAPMWYVNYSDLVKCCFCLAYTASDGSTGEIVSDGQLKTAPSHIVSGDLWHGENVDFRLFSEGWDEPGFDDSRWKPVLPVQTPKTSFFLQTSPSDRVMRRITPRLLKREKDYAIYDAGENITGTPVFTGVLPAGEQVTVTMTEEINEANELQRVLRHGAHIKPQCNTYIGDGKNHFFRTEFTWQGFRYFDCPAQLQPVTVEVIHANVHPRAGFSSGEPILNWLFDAFSRTMLTNLHGGIPSDCPHYERRGYTGDGQVTAEAAMILFDAEAFYRKWIDDISDCQDRKTGHVQYTAPYNDAGGGPGGWGCAIVEVPYIFYRQYGDAEPMERLFGQMLRYFDFLDAHSEGGLVTSDVEGNWCLGDWAIPEQYRADMIRLPPPLVNTCFYIRSMQRVQTIAGVLGRGEEVAFLEEKIQAVKQAIVGKYFDPLTGDFAEDKHCANVFALTVGLGDERTKENLVRHVTEAGRYDCGIFGIEWLTGYLLSSGEEDLAFSLLTSRHPLSFRNMMENGATTLWEHFDGTRSHNHPMFGALVRHFYLRILGIDQPAGQGGYRSLLLHPVFPSGLSHAEGYIDTAFGRVNVAWKRKNGKIAYSVTLPSGIFAIIMTDKGEKPLAGGQTHSVYF